MANPLYTSIDVSNALYKHYIVEWQRVKLILMRNHVVSVKETTPLYAEKYKFDLWGLFRDVFFIDTPYIYPHMICNGYDSSNIYNGNQLRFNILDNNILTTYYKLFKRNKQRQEDFEALGLTPLS